MSDSEFMTPAMDIHIGQRRRMPAVCPHCNSADFGYAYMMPVLGWFGFVTWRFSCAHMTYANRLSQIVAEHPDLGEKLKASFKLASIELSSLLYGVYENAPVERPTSGYALYWPPVTA